MSEETAQVAADVVVAAPDAAPVTGSTAEPVDSPVVGEEVKPETKDTPKTFTQEDVDRIVSKEKAREARKAQREIDQRIAEALKNHAPQTQVTPDAPQKPKPEQFTTTEEYVEALTAYKADEIFRTRTQESESQRREAEQRQRHQSVVSSYQERVEQAMDKYPDFEDVAYSPDVPITNAMAATIQESEKGPDIAYFLGKNPAEAQRIAKLSPFLQAKELGKLEAKLESAPAPVKTSNAPPPINPIRNATAGTGFVDTTDPKSLKQMGTSAWIEAENRRMAEEWKRRRAG
jgi:ElaB/YqjD/DUF883 family membrane-anchored ribosome-binding protein